MVNPSNLVAFDDVRRYIKGVIIEPQVCTEDDFRKFMETVYPQLMGVKEEQERIERQTRKSARDERRRTRRRPPDGIPDAESRRPAERNSQRHGGSVRRGRKAYNAMELDHRFRRRAVVRLANNILALAIKKGASDIHIEPQEKGVVLRLRVDGVLKVENILSKKIQLPLASRFKILSRLDISERRMPQDGRISIKIDDRAHRFPRFDGSGEVRRKDRHAYSRQERIATAAR